MGDHADGRCPRAVTLAALFAGALALAACGAPPPADPAPMPGEPLVTLPSDNGTWVVSIETSPQPPRKGSVDVTYRITDGAGAPADGLGLDVLPWMPAHGHGTSAAALVTPQGDGRYLATPVYLYMAGHWELRTTIQGSDVTDTVVPAFDVP